MASDPQSDAERVGTDTEKPMREIADEEYTDPPQAVSEAAGSGVLESQSGCIYLQYPCAPSCTISCSEETESCASSTEATSRAGGSGTVACSVEEESSGCGCTCTARSSALGG